MLYRTLVLMAALCAFAIGLQAQTITLRDQVTNELIAKADIICLTNNTKVTTNEAGQADISTLKDCGSILVDHVSFQERTITWAEVASGADVLLNYRVNMLDQVVTERQPVRRETKRRARKDRRDQGARHPFHGSTNHR
ncbi:MAG: hypothetical protein IPO90_00570 [Flavobacteriales bacterium]|nr:hypothetical protein [Flavobacteriales bacterium]